MSYAEEQSDNVEEITLNLKLPRPHITENPKLFSYDSDEFKSILFIYSNYLALSAKYPQLLLDLELSDKEAFIILKEKEQCMSALKKSEEDRSFIYDVREQESKEYSKQQNSNKIKLILGTGLGGLAGIGIGVIIMLFAN